MNGVATIFMSNKGLFDLLLDIDEKFVHVQDSSLESIR